MTSEEYYKMETETKVFAVDCMICGVNEWIPLLTLIQYNSYQRLEFSYNKLN